MQLAFFFDQSRCVGCYTCAVACKDWNDIPAGPAHWRRITQFEEGEYPLPFVANLSAACNHCEEPVCAVVCPAGAITKRDEDGIVLVDRNKCREEAHCGIISKYKTKVSLTMGEREAPCQVTCPAHLKVPGYIALISKGKFTEALELIRQNMPLPSVCGRICSHPCESECKRKDLDEPLAIASLRRFVADASVGNMPKPVPITKKDKVAIIGSGPSGLAAAYDLVRMGYSVTIFEALPVVGGMLAIGIPNYRLPKEVLQRDIDYIKALGVEIRTNSPIGTKLTFDDLAHRGYSATFIATGSHKGIELPIPGMELKNTLIGIDFLRDVNTGKQVKIGKKVVVLGGGNVAFDCARTALRLGASEAHVVCAEGRDEMRAFPEEIEEGKQEGVVIHASQVFTCVQGKGGSACGVECLKIRGMKFDKAGKLKVDSISGTEYVISCDTVIMAVGQVPDMSFLGAVGGLKLTGRGTIIVDPETMETSRPGIFAGGDAVQPMGTAIEAIAAGQKAAINIDRYLKGEVLKGVQKARVIKASDIEVEIPVDIKKASRQKMPTITPSKRLKGFEEVNKGFDEKKAIAEAQRCMNCAGSLCRDVCPYGSPQFGAEENAKMQKCNFCVDRWAENAPPICVAACPMRALDAGTVEQLKVKYGNIKEAVGFTYSPVTEPPTLFKTKK